MSVLLKFQCTYESARTLARTQIQIQRVWDSAFLSISAVLSLFDGPRFESSKSAYLTCSHVERCQFKISKTSDVFTSWGMWKYLNNVKCPVELQTRKRRISFPVWLTWQECIRAHVGSESSRTGIHVQIRLWKSCPHSSLHCNAYIHLDSRDQKEKKKLKWMKQKSVKTRIPLEGSRLPLATCSYVLSNGHLTVT